jgi:hypothetical protein
MSNENEYSSSEIARIGRTAYTDTMRNGTGNNEPYLAVALLEEVRKQNIGAPDRLAKIINGDLYALIDVAVQQATANLATQAVTIKQQITSNPKRLKILQNILWKKKLLLEFTCENKSLADAPEDIKFALEDEEDKIAGGLAETLYQWTRHPSESSTPIIS